MYKQPGAPPLCEHGEYGECSRNLESGNTERSITTSPVPTGGDPSGNLEVARVNTETRLAKAGGIDGGGGIILLSAGFCSN